jgi:hypothetical protein
MTSWKDLFESPKLASWSAITLPLTLLMILLADSAFAAADSVWSTKRCQRYGAACRGEIECRLPIRERADDAGSPPDLAQNAFERIVIWRTLDVERSQI